MTYLLDRLLTREQLQTKLNVRKRCIQLWQADRGLPSIKIGGKVYFDPVAVDAWLQRAGNNAA